MISQKRSQVHSQFNWMYVLIVGGFFILLFVTMSMRQADSAQQRISATALEGISNIFEAARTGTSMSATVSIPDLEIEFTCRQGILSEVFGDRLYSEYRVGGFSRRIDELPTFVPGILEGDNLITWTQSWDMPMPIMNFLYITNEQTRFFFIENEEFPEIYWRIEDSFSSNMQSEFLQSIAEERFADFNDDFSIVVIFSDDPRPNEIDDIVETFSGHVRVVQVSPDDDFFGKVKYYDEFGDNAGEVNYAGRASLYGAIISPDADYYECSMTKALRRMARIACVHYRKHVELQDYYSDNVNCRRVYNNAVASFDDFFGDDFCNTNADGALELGDFSLDFAEDFDAFKRFHSNLMSAYDGARRGSCARPY